MMNKPRIILDTKILISYILKPSTGIQKVVETTINSGQLLISQDTFDKLQHVIERFVKRGFVQIEDYSDFLGSIVEVAEWIKILEPVHICRDPKDDKFLALATNGQADYLITSNKDLLVHHNFKGTKILTPAEFSESFAL